MLRQFFLIKYKTSSCQFSDDIVMCYTCGDKRERINERYEII
ncbi:hypothetical protein QSI_4195 [Clostridioides difficile P28]|nr:hypothetical protein QSI_4195 [Clostridioides difficile P28]